MTEWRPVCGYEHLYSVSDDGDVRRDAGGERVKAGRILKRLPNSRGYVTVCLCADGIVTRFTIHQLVCAAFHGPRPSEKHEVAHGNGVRTDNRAANLRWAMRSENHADKLKHGTHSRGKNARWAKLTESDVEIIRHSTETQRALADRFGVAQGHICRIKNNLRWMEEA